MTHKGKLHYFPALQGYQFRCAKCGKTLLADIEKLEVEIDGDCDPPETLGISVKEEVGVKDYFGGK